ncbi:MAG: dihydrofolate reductase family protein [Dermatophilaceae bacterium]
MRALLDSHPDLATSGVTDDDLAGHYAFPTGRIWLRANMVTTVDGAVGGADGRSGSVNTAADRRVFHLQRDLCDAVLVGAGTARAEGYGRVGPTPRSPIPAALVVVTRSGRVPGTLLEADATRGPLLVLTCAAAGSERLAALTDALGTDAILVCGDNEVDLHAGLTRLADRGLRGILCEGGPSLLSAAFAAGLVDELALTLAPTVVGGDAGRMTSGPALARGHGIRMAPHVLFEEDGTLLGLWRVIRSSRAGSPPRRTPTDTRRD